MVSSPGSHSQCIGVWKSYRCLGYWMYFRRVTGKNRAISRYVDCSIILIKYLYLIGNDYIDQVQRTIAVLGSPSDEDMAYIGNQSAIAYIKSLPKRSKIKLSALYPNANPLALDLLSKMLVFNPEERITVKESLEHPYFAGLHNADEEPISDKQFDWWWDDFEPTKELLQSMVYDEAVKFQKEK